MNDTPLTDPRLRDYLEDVRLWHGYVRFLGLPTLQDRPDTPLTDLFVPPQLSEQRVAPEADPARWPQGIDVLSALQTRRRLVVLGDPGSGKSTVVNWLAWLLASGESASLPEAMAGLLPLPMVARELKLGQIKGFDDLLAAFLARPVAQALSAQPGLLNEYLDRGQVLLLLDGLDEVAFDQREALRDALRDGWSRHPGMLMLATSRIVGYEECPLDPVISAPPAHDDPQVQEALRKADAYAMRRLSTLLTDVYFNGAEARTPVLYVMPFDDARVQAFAQQWYRLRSIKQVAQADAASFTRALLSEPGVGQLARTPQLLTLMALVYRVRAQLPDGRALLYDMITEAYLESIDTSRALAADPYPWREKRRWLARVGFEMQVMRSELGTAATSNPMPGEDRELLVSQDQVLHWLKQAMAQSGYVAPDASFAEAYLDWVARRSGLLLPRGEGRFAFVHLSFQEYFAALYLSEHLSDADWVIAQRDGVPDEEGDARVTARALSNWAGDRLWQETLVFAQEGCAHNPRDARRLAGWLFGEGFSGFMEGVPSDPDAPVTTAGAVHACGELLARLVANPHAGLAEADRERAMSAAMQFLERVERRFEAYSFMLHMRGGALKRLLGASHSRASFWNAVATRRDEHLTLDGAGEIDAREFSPLVWLKTIVVDELPNEDLSALSSLRGMECLWSQSAPEVLSLEPLGELIHLQLLGFGNSKIKDLRPLSRLSELKSLYLNGASCSDLRPLASLPNLGSLYISGSQIETIAPLAACTSLNWVNVSGVAARDLSPLDRLPLLRELTIATHQPLTHSLKAREASGQLTVKWSDGPPPSSP